MHHERKSEVSSVLQELKPKGVTVSAMLAKAVAIVLEKVRKIHARTLARLSLIFVRGLFCSSTLSLMLSTTLPMAEASSIART
jgi:hypothetical protein